MKHTKTEMLIILFLAMLVISLILAIRIALHSPFLLGDEPYYHIRVAKALLDRDFENKLVYGWQPFIFNPYHLLLALGLLTVGPNAALAISFGAGILSLILIQKLLLKINIQGPAQLILMIFYITSPVFLYSLFISHPSIVALLLQLTGFLLYTSQKRKVVLASLSFFSLAAFFGLFHLAVTLLILGAYSFYTKQKLHHFYLLVFIFSLILIFVYTPQLTKEASLLLHKPQITNFVTDLGAKTGFTIFVMALATLGFLNLWSKKKDALLSAGMFFVSATILFETDLVYTNLLITFFAGLGFLHLLKSRWKLRLKTISIILVITSLAFSAGSYTIRLAEKMPNTPLIEGLTWLKQNSEPGDIILSNIENSFWIQTIAERAVLADKFSSKIKSSVESINIIESIFNSYDIEKTKKMLYAYNIRHILMTAPMLQSSTTSRGLSYLLKNSKTFKKMYGNEILEIYIIEDYGSV